MKFIKRLWKCNGADDQTVIEVTFDAANIAAASGIASAKVKFINAHNPGGIRRPPEVIKNRIIAGKLADAVPRMSNNCTDEGRCRTALTPMHPSFKKFGQVDRKKSSAKFA